MARSFDRIRSIVRKKRMGNKEKSENEANTKMEKIVNEVIVRRRVEKRGGEKQHVFTTLSVPQSTIYRHSYQVIIYQETKSEQYKKSFLLKKKINKICDIMLSLYRSL